jgi:phenylacetic acid degradation operon negative regulatory protein
VPDTERHLRHRLRQQLIWLGCGMMAPGTWIGPGHLLHEAIEVLDQQSLRGYVTVMRAEDPCPPGRLSDAVAGWWDFADLNSRYGAFLAAHARTGQRWDGSDRQAFTEHLRLVDDWRPIPYLDPGLPPSLTPPGWLGRQGVELFAQLQAQLAAPAARHVQSVVAGRLEGVSR